MFSFHESLLWMYTGYRHWPLSFAVCWQSDSLKTAVLPPLGQCCGTVCLNSFGNRTSPLDNSNDGWKRLCLVSWAAATCVWTLRATTRNLLTYSVCYLTSWWTEFRFLNFNSVSLHSLQHSSVNVLFQVKCCGWLIALMYIQDLESTDIVPSESWKSHWISWSQPMENFPAATEC